MYIRATMTGTVWKILVAVGEQVEVGQEVIILESMKMEIPIQAEKSGRVKKILVEEGSFVNEDGVLIELEN
jgi:acetyl-CoA carboxylase biotin carboxyl carrier protein